MQLDVLTHGQVGGSARVLFGDISDRAQLVRLQQSVRNTDAHHEIRERLPFPVLAADHSRPISLGVHAPPAEIGADPFGRDRAKTLAGKPPDFVKALPRVLLAFQSLDPLRFRFFDWICHKCKKPTASKCLLAVG